MVADDSKNESVQVPDSLTLKKRVKDVKAKIPLIFKKGGNLVKRTVPFVKLFRNVANLYLIYLVSRSLGEVKKDTSMISHKLDEALWYNDLDRSSEASNSELSELGRHDVKIVRQLNKDEVNGT